MQFSVLPNWAAPLSTGHPFGLPETSVQVKSATRVAPVSQQSSSDTGMMQEKSPAPYRRPVAGQRVSSTHVAPPSIMQLKIIELLNTQAQNLPSQTAEAEVEAEPKSEATDQVSEGPEGSAKGPEQPQTLSKSGYGQLPGFSKDESTAMEDTMF